jgi:hypothetical protein
VKQTKYFHFLLRASLSIGSQTFCNFILLKSLAFF